jgi:tripartite-type tricarboxylate transporter receptor subunit TctC
MAPMLKGSFVMDNKPGAGGAIATDMAAKSAPDGYTIAIGGATTLVLLPASNPKLPYNALKDFAYIGQVGTAAIALMATNDVPANTLPELVALAKKTPGSLQYASWGIGSTGHFCGELMNLKTQAQLSHVPYKSVAQIQTDLLGGHIKLGFVDMGSATSLVKTGRVKAITTCTSRSPSLPGVSSYEDEGIDFNGLRMGALRWALFAPAATPRPIIDKLAAALKATLDMPEVKARLLEMGISAAFVGGDELLTMTARDIEGWKAIAKQAGISNE